MKARQLWSNIGEFNADKKVNERGHRKYTYAEAVGLQILTREHRTFTTPVLVKKEAA